MVVSQYRSVFSPFFLLYKQENHRHIQGSKMVYPRSTYFCWFSFSSLKVSGIFIYHQLSSWPWLLVRGWKKGDHWSNGRTIRPSLFPEVSLFLSHILGPFNYCKPLKELMYKEKAVKKTAFSLRAIFIPGIHLYLSKSLCWG